MPLYEEKFLSPFAIRFSQARIRPTFQDGRLVDRSMSQVEAVPWPLEGSSDYDVFLNAPFPPIEIIRWRPKIREEDGRTCVDEDGRKMLGEACWFTFDNRRLYCLQAAASKHWPRRVAAIVHIMHDLPLSKSTPRKFRTTDLGYSVRISWRHNVVPRATWSWGEATRSNNGEAQLSEEGKTALASVQADAAKEDWSELVEVPYDIAQLSSQLAPLEPSNPQALAQGIIPTGHDPSGAYGDDDEVEAAPPPRREAHSKYGYSNGVAAAAPAAHGRRATAGNSAVAAGGAGASKGWLNATAQEFHPAASNGLNGFGGSSALTVSALAAQFAQAQVQAQVQAQAQAQAQARAAHAQALAEAQAQARQELAALSSGSKANGSLLTHGMTPAMALAMTSPFAPAAAGPSCNNGSSLRGGSQLSSVNNSGSLLSAPQMLLPVSSSPDDDDDEENCVQS